MSGLFSNKILIRCDSTRPYPRIYSSDEIKVAKTYIKPNEQLTQNELLPSIEVKFWSILRFWGKHLRSDSCSPLFIHFIKTFVKFKVTT